MEKIKQMLGRIKKLKVNRQLELFMDKIKEDNPDATWGNLIAGIAIILLVAVVSVNYFNREITNKNTLPIEVINEGSDSAVEDYGIYEMSGEVTTVQPGEGLWNVAERVCGDGEAYNILAEANGLSIYSPVSVGQELKVICQ